VPSVLVYRASFITTDPVIPANPGSGSGTGAGIQKKPGFSPIKYGTSLVKAGTATYMRLVSSCAIGVEKKCIKKPKKEEEL